MLEWQSFVLLLVASLAQGEILTPPYFNLAEGREISASATCGEDIPGGELYCKLVGANADQDEDINLIQGQVSNANDDNMIQIFQFLSTMDNSNQNPLHGPLYGENV